MCLNLYGVLYISANYGYGPVLQESFAAAFPVAGGVFFFLHNWLNICFWFSILYEKLLCENATTTNAYYIFGVFDHILPCPFLWVEERDDSQGVASQISRGNSIGTACGRKSCGQVSHALQMNRTNASPYPQRLIQA